MRVVLYNNKSESIRRNKELEMLAETNTIMRDSTIEDPLLRLNIDTSTLIKCNYIYIDELKRYYYVVNKNALNNSTWELNCHVDVLMSAGEALNNCAGVLARQENLYNIYLNDEYFKVSQKQQIQTKKFGVGFGDELAYIITTGGGSADIVPE